MRQEPRRLIASDSTNSRMLKISNRLGAGSRGRVRRRSGVSCMIVIVQPASLTTLGEMLPNSEPSTELRGEPIST